MENRRIFKCFISSPNDCKDERENCIKVIKKIDSGFAKHFGIGLETFMWEYDILPDMGRNVQEIIDEYVKKSNYDVFIGIMKNRFGHPTKKAGSGTEHEFKDALERKKDNQNGLPRIVFFFGKENVDPENFDFEHYQKVKLFKTVISSKGLYVDYSGIDKFEEQLKQKLELFIKENTKIENAEEKISEINII